MINKKIIITGALGQDGKILSKILIKKKYKVFGLIRSKKYNFRVKGVKYFRNDLSDKNKLFKLIKRIKPSATIHLGSDNPSFKELKQRKDFLKKNFQSTKNLINALLKINLKTYFLFPNTSQIYLNKKHKIVNEKSISSSTNNYANFRIKTLKYLEKVKNNKFSYTNIILFNHDSKYRHKKFLLPRLMKSIKKNNITFLNYIISQNIKADFSHAENICFAIYKLIKLNKKINKIILSSGKCTKVNDIIKYVIKKNKININLNFNITNKSTKCLIGNNKYAKKILNWLPKKNIYIAAYELFNYSK